jgi:pimeloyl-ACP methyl ester carboxylesterase
MCSAILIVALSVISCSQTDQEQSDRIVDLGTHALHVQLAGGGSPVVVVDVGIAALAEEWRSLQSSLAQETRVVLYDRAGYGRSEPGPLPRDSGREMEELESLLQALPIPGPYVLVGHSLGALNVQVYAARHPRDVAGLVLLDPPPLGWLLGEKYSDLHAVADRMTDEWRTIAERFGESANPKEKARADFFRMIASEHHEMLRESARLATEIETFGDTPLVVIASGRPNPAFGAIAEEYQAYWIQQSRALAEKSSRGRFVLMEDSSHRLHEDAADQVLAEILSILAEAGGR